MVDNREKRCYERKNKLIGFNPGMIARVYRILKTCLKKEEGGDGGRVLVIG
jgi:hypothetical protein